MCSLAPLGIAPSGIIKDTPDSGSAIRPPAVVTRLLLTQSMSEQPWTEDELLEDLSSRQDTAETLIIPQS